MATLHVRHPAPPGSRRAFRLLCCFLAVAATQACSRSFRPQSHAIPGPAGEIAGAPLGSGRIAVLAGTNDAKGIFVIEEQTGKVLRSFGVTKEATGVSAQGDNGPLLLSIGAERDGKSLGAVEQWSLLGYKERVVPLPSAGLGITRMVHGTAFVLVGGAGKARAALRLAAAHLRIGRPIPLAADAKSLAQCAAEDRTFLLYTDGDHGWLMIRDIESGSEVHSAVEADGATCPSDGSAAYAIGGGGFNRSIFTMSIPSLRETSSRAASADAVALLESNDQHLMALNSTPRVASIETFIDEAEVERTAASQWAATEAH